MPLNKAECDLWSLTVWFMSFNIRMILSHRVLNKAAPELLCLHLSWKTFLFHTYDSETTNWVTARQRFRRKHTFPDGPLRSSFFFYLLLVNVEVVRSFFIWLEIGELSVFVESINLQETIRGKIKTTAACQQRWVIVAMHQARSNFDTLAKIFDPRLTATPTPYSSRTS